MPAPEYRTLTTQSPLFSHRILSLARWLTLLGTCTAPLLAQAESCPSGDNTDDQYILGEADGVASAMHWPTGLVWKRCSEGQTFENGQCTGTAQTKDWNTWAETDRLLPKSFNNQTKWGIGADFRQNLLESGGWRMAYKNELRKITEPCDTIAPKVNRIVFPDTPSSAIWSGSPRYNEYDFAFFVNPYHGYFSYYDRSYNYHVRLVRGGEPFDPLTTPPAQDAAPGSTASFPAFTLSTPTSPISTSLPDGQSWGGARISGDGNPEFQLNGTGDWVQQAIVKSGDQITVRLTAPVTVGANHTATFTLRSGRTTGTTDTSNEAYPGSEATAMQETSASFTVNVVPIAGVCGTAGGVATLAAPSANLCSAGTASAVDGSATAFTWTCLGQYGGADSGQCSAPRQYEVTPSAGANGTIAPASVQLVTAGQTASFAVTPEANYSPAISGTCPAGSWSGSSYTTGSIMASCTVTANFAARTAIALPLPAGPHSGETLDLTVTGSEWHIDAAQSLTAATLGATLPPKVTLPHGAVSLRLTNGTPGSNATVVLTYPEDLPAGTRYYKYGPTADNPTDHWYRYAGAVISGNTITLTLTDGGAGDSDLSVNGIIADPGGPAWITQDVAPIPTLPQWAMMLLAGIMGMLALSKVQRVRST
ncbi:IPTL-CTERM sorting domain-containing protein [Marinobacterium iners]|uniref:IPTL-CTERM protein sorting domain-containing protein n=1 Tax=Marinobacterium iners DSM 11526 TaxID=1122198 RepID=A0A1H4C2V6_9GAMM|nr:IPTL-CTERM sorting domain-containing protein [Marinobacterium iners]SEA54741.1 IPTL-CTERM protein sorting domain-containing protein [Marinobacterium iners DSM 11526]